MNVKAFPMMSSTLEQIASCNHIFNNIVIIIKCEHNIVFLSTVISSLAKSSAAFGFAVSPHAHSIIIIIKNYINNDDDDNDNDNAHLMMMMTIIIIVVIIIIIINNNYNDFVQGIHWMALHLNFYTKVSQ